MAVCLLCLKLNWDKLIACDNQDHRILEYIAVPRFISWLMGSDTAMDDTVLGLSRVEVQREGDSPSSDIGELLVIKAEWLDASTEIHVHYTVTVITENLLQNITFLKDSVDIKYPHESVL